MYSDDIAGPSNTPKPAQSHGNRRTRSPANVDRPPGSRDSFSCTTNNCTKSFTHKSYLTAHERTHTKEKPYICQYADCDKRFTQKSSLNTHMWLHNKYKRFECNYPDCGKSFTYKLYLLAHTRVHSGEKPYVCMVAGCEKRFTQKSTLNGHMRVHNGVKPYVCSGGRNDNDGGSNNEKIRRSGTQRNLNQDTNFRSPSQCLAGLVKQSRFMYVCDEFGCGQEFNRECTWRAHMKRHSQSDDDDYY